MKSVFEINYNELIGLRKDFSSLLDNVTQFHNDTQTELQYLHIQYIDVSKKLKALIDNLENLQDIFSKKDIILMKNSLDNLKHTLNDNSNYLPNNKFKSENLLNIINSIDELHDIVKKFKKSFRNQLIHQQIRPIVNEEDGDSDINTSIRNIITADLYSLIRILESTLVVLENLITTGNGSGNKKENNILSAFEQIDFLINRILRLHKSFENNISSISVEFEKCQKLGDEIITVLQYQDIFGQKMVHIIKIIENLKIELDDCEPGDNKNHRYLSILPEISSILIAQIKLVENEFLNSINTIADRLTEISMNFESTEQNFRKLSGFSGEQLQHVNSRPHKNGKSNILISGATGKRGIDFHNVIENKLDTLEHEIDQVINEVLKIKSKVKEVIFNAFSTENIKSGMESMNNIQAFLSLNTKLMDVIESKSLNNHGDLSLVSLSNKLFNEIVSSLQKTKKRFRSIRKMNDQSKNIINHLSKLVELKIENNHFSNSEKISILEDFKKTYSMQSERMAHDMALGTIHVEETQEEDDLGNVEFF